MTGLLDDSLLRAVRAQNENDFSHAIRLYDECLVLDPQNFIALHMRAVALYQLGCMNESRTAFQQLALTHPALPPEVWNNVGLLTAATHGLGQEDARAEAARERYRAWKATAAAALASETILAHTAPAIGVVVPSYNHAEFVEDALRSIAEQAHLPQELIVIDDGSQDGSPERIACALKQFPPDVKVEFIARANRGAAASLNEAIDRLSTPWVAPLNSDDLFDRERLLRLRDAAMRLEHLGVDFMFGSIDLIDSDGVPVQPPYAPFTSAVMASHRSFHGYDSTGLGLLAANCTVSTGNQFFSRKLWRRLGGYSDMRYCHDWDFALRSSLHSEPMHVPQARYAYRVHDSNTNAGAGEAARDEVKTLRQRFISESFHDATGAHSPTFANWGSAFLGVVGCVGGLAWIPGDALRGSQATGRGRDA